MEYLIRRVDGEWFSLHKDQLGEALRPSSFPSHYVQGWGDWRIHTEGVDISFSYEDPGIQVCIEGELDLTVANQIVEEILKNIDKNIELVTGQKGRVVPL